MTKRTIYINRSLLFVSLFLIGILLRYESKPQAATPYVVPASIAADCSRDVSSEINAWLQSVPNNSTANFKSGACYRIDQTIKLVSRSNFTIDGLGANFKAMTDGRETANPQTRVHFLIYTSSNVVARNINVHGINPNTGTANAYVTELEGQHGFSIISSNSVVLDGVGVYKVYGDFVYTGRQGGTIPSGIVVKNSKFDGSGRQGMAFSAVDNIVVENNDIARAARATFDLEPNTSAWKITNVAIRNNRIVAGRLLFIANAGNCAEVKNITVENNTLSSKTMDMWSFAPSGCTIVRGPFVFSGNISNAQSGNSGMHTIRFDGAKDVAVRNNRQPMQAGRDMRFVKLQNSANIQVTGNTLPNAIAAVLLASGVTNLCQENNYITGALSLEATTSPCTQLPPTQPPIPPTNPNEPPVVVEDTTNEIIEDLKLSDPPAVPLVTSVDGPQANQEAAGGEQPTGEVPTGLVPGDQGANLESSNTTSQTGSFSSRAYKAFKDIPSTLGETVTNLDDLGSVLNDPDKRASLIMFGSLLTTGSVSTETIMFWRKHMHKLKVFRRSHGLDRLPEKPDKVSKTAKTEPAKPEASLIKPDQTSKN